MARRIDVTVAGLPFGPPVDPGPSSWEEAVATRTYVAVEDWYAANTGHEALGIAEGDLVDGSLTSEFDGQVIEGIVGSHIRIGHSNVTVRGCRVVNGATYGAYLNPTFTAMVTGVVIEYCTFVHPDEMVVEADAKSSAYLLPAATSQHSTTLRNCNMYRWGGGVRISNRAIMEYCWVHDFQHPPGVHANAARGTHNGAVMRRNYLTDGRSGVCSIYFDKEPTHNITMQENILTGSSPGATPSYLINLKDGAYAASATGIKILGNMFGTGYQSGVFADALGLPWGSSGNERTGNEWFLTGEPVANS